MNNSRKRKSSGTRRSIKLSPNKKTKQAFFFGSVIGFTKNMLDEKFKGQKLLLDGSIYDKKGPPTELEEKLLQLSIHYVVPISKEKSHPQFRCKYEYVVID